MAVPQGFDVPFRMVEERSSPNFVERDDVLDRSIKTILLTFPGERVYRPNFGSYLRSLIFANMTEANGLQAADEIKRAVTTWEPRVTIDDIGFELDEHTIYVNVSWRANGSRTGQITEIEFNV